MSQENVLCFSNDITLYSAQVFAKYMQYSGPAPYPPVWFFFLMIIQCLDMFRPWLASA